MEMTNKQRMMLKMSNCVQLAPWRLVNIWHCYKDSSDVGVKVFAEWAWAAAILKLRCLASLTKEATVRAEKAKEWLLAAGEECLETVRDIDLAVDDSDEDIDPGETEDVLDLGDDCLIPYDDMTDFSEYDS